MAGHSKWANIQHRKGAQDAKRGKLFTKLIREITVAARMGGGDPSTNSRLRLAIDKALTANMSKDTVERAIKRGMGALVGQHFEEVRYEGYAPGGVAVMVDCMTANRTRTVGEVRHAFNKCGGNLGTDGSVAYLFNNSGVLSYPAGSNEDKLMEVALEAGADDVERHADGSVDVKEAMAKAGLEPESAEVTMRAAVSVTLGAEDAVKKMKMLEMLEDIDDVQYVYSNADFPDDVLAALARRPLRCRRCRAPTCTLAPHAPHTRHRPRLARDRLRHYRTARPRVALCGLGLCAHGAGRIPRAPARDLRWLAPPRGRIPTQRSRHRKSLRAAQCRFRPQAGAGARCGAVRGDESGAAGGGVRAHANQAGAGRARRRDQGTGATYGEDLVAALRHAARRRRRCAGLRAVPRPHPGDPDPPAGDGARHARGALAIIGRLRGVLLAKQSSHILIDVQGVGYEVEVPLTTFFRLPAPNKKVRQHTHLIVREVAHGLYGFAAESDRALFRDLIKEHGVGAKLAATIQSGIAVEVFVRSVRAGDVARLTRLPGIGKKTAERLVMEMRDRLDVKGSHFTGMKTEVTGPAEIEPNPVDDAGAALVALGYKPPDASRMVLRVKADGLACEEIIRRALQGGLKAWSATGPRADLRRAR